MREEAGSLTPWEHPQTSPLHGQGQRGSSLPFLFPQTHALWPSQDPSFIFLVVSASLSLMCKYLPPLFPDSVVSAFSQRFSSFFCQSLLESKGREQEHPLTWHKGKIAVWGSEALGLIPEICSCLPTPTTKPEAVATGSVLNSCLSAGYHASAIFANNIEPWPAPGDLGAGVKPGICVDNNSIRKVREHCFNDSEFLSSSDSILLRCSKTGLPNSNHSVPPSRFLPYLETPST